MAWHSPRRSLQPAFLKQMYRILLNAVVISVGCNAIAVGMLYVMNWRQRRKLRDAKAAQRDWSTVSDGKTERTYRGDGKLMHTRELPPVKWPHRN